ncbi:alpha/beta fold hydrolase [Phyllobacterium leguminum]|uniref:Alpha-beta hydrolase superfamily lysophospholipase n=1 Tax=Phyllobacterium leguminum TaxID=314237 RepID=A0A318T5G1_9HYPH|nr:alpha/beta hydrolase [Phyllobacterium leguminum]PYE88272.1 alpha-beta hydrolase superfamily lysophospholipase [Phyllobacterium leguminum]
MAPFVLQVTRLGFEVYGRIAPKRAGRAAFNLFCRTPGRKPKTKSYAEKLARAEARMRKARRLDLTIDRGMFTSYLFEPDKPSGGTSLVVHGWGSRAADMLAIVDALLDTCERVVAIDLPGHGASPGRALNMVQAIAAVDAAWREYGPFNAMIGHSFGGAVVVNAAAGAVPCYPAHRPQKLITIASPHSMIEVFDDFGKAVGLPPQVRNAMDDEVLRLACRPLAAFDTPQHLRQMGIPALAIHARDDKEVSAKSAEAKAAAGPHITLHWADGLGHRRIIASPEIAARVAQFVTGQGAMVEAA